MVRPPAPPRHWSSTSTAADRFARPGRTPKRTRSAPAGKQQQHVSSSSLYVTPPEPRSHEESRRSTKTITTEAPRAAVSVARRRFAAARSDERVETQPTGRSPIVFPPVHLSG